MAKEAIASSDLAKTMLECQLHILKCRPARSQWKCWDTFIPEGNRKMRPQRHTRHRRRISLRPLGWDDCPPLLFRCCPTLIHFTCPSCCSGVCPNVPRSVYNFSSTHARRLLPKKSCILCVFWSGLNSGLHCSTPPQWFAAVLHFFGPYP